MLCKVKVCTRSIKVVTYINISKLIHGFIKVNTCIYQGVTFIFPPLPNQTKLKFDFKASTSVVEFNELCLLKFQLCNMQCAVIHDRFQKLKVVINTNVEQVLCHSHALRQQILLITLLFSFLDSTQAGQYTLLILSYFAFSEAGATVAHFSHSHILALVM